MSERPDFVPAMWSRGRLNRWVGQEPRRVVAWFTCAPVIAVLVAIGFVLSGSWLGWLVAVAAAVLLVQSAVYLPRALEASRRQRS
jgi:hypothetical protein